MNSASSVLKLIPLKEFETKFIELISNKVKFFTYFHGGYGDNGKSWCSDCDVAKPIIDEAAKQLENQDKVLFVKLSIDDKDEWKKPNFILRIHSKVKLTKVPTLIYYQDGIEYGRLTEEELFDSSNVNEFVKQSLE